MASFALSPPREPLSLWPDPPRSRSPDHSPFLFFWWGLPSFSCGSRNPMLGFWHCCSALLPQPQVFSTPEFSRPHSATLLPLFAPCLQECFVRSSIFSSLCSRCNRPWIGACRG